MATVLQTAAGAIDKASSQLSHTTQRVGNQLQITTDRVFPPQQREDLLKKFRVFANRNPKLAAFLTAQAALTGIPLILFLAFAATTLLVSLTTCVLLGLLAALAFTSLVVGFALLFVVPTVIIASCSATFIFIWGFVGYIILRKLNEGEAPAKPGTRVGDGLQRLTGGRLGLWVGDGASEDGRKKNPKTNTPSTARGQGRVDGYENRHRASHEENDGPLNGDHASDGYVEWDRKWDNGAQPQSVILETGNTYEVLKKESPLA
ncbi:hypothetical protein ACN47E_010180 [Coniothyrium glycines]